MTPIDLSTDSNTPHEERISSRRAYDGRILHLRVDDVRLPSGRKSVREIIEHPGSAIVLPITNDNDVLFIRSFRYAIDRHVVELPAGLIDPGESPETAATRELVEETGYQAGAIRFLGAAYVSPGYTQEKSHFYLATGCHQVEHQPDQDEPIDLLRVPLDVVPDLIRPGESQIENAQALLALNWFLRTRDELPG